MMYCATGKIDHVKLRTKYMENWDMGVAGDMQCLLERTGGAFGCPLEQHDGEGGRCVVFLLDVWGDTGQRPVIPVSGAMFLLVPHSF